MITRLKDYRLRKRLDKMIDTALARQDGNPANKYRDFHDYLTDPERLEYSTLATKHFRLRQRQGKTSPYFYSRVDWAKDDPNSPIGLLTVQHDVSSAVEIFSVPVTDGETLDFVVRDGRLEIPSWATGEQIDLVMEKWNTRD